MVAAELGVLDEFRFVHHLQELVFGGEVVFPAILFRGARGAGGVCTSRARQGAFVSKLFVWIGIGLFGGLGGEGEGRGKGEGIFMYGREERRTGDAEAERVGVGSEEAV